nr:hypothetical protein [Bacteroidota bacterium]
MIDLESIPGVVIRQGTNEDIDFITESLIMASKGGTSVFPYERIFGIEEEEFAIICNNILREDVPGSEFYCGSHMLFTYDEVIIAGLSAWVEGKSGYGSNMIKAMLLSSYIGQERWLKGLEVLEEISVIEGKRQPGVIQMESAYKKWSVFNWFLKEIQGKAG